MRKLIPLLIVLLLLGILAGCLTGLLLKFDFDGRRDLSAPVHKSCKP